MDSSRLIYEPLSSDVQKSTLPPLRSYEPFIQAYVKSLLPQQHHSSVDESRHKTCPLVGVKAAQRKRRPHHLKGALSLCERRRLGLYQLSRYGSNYSDAAPIHSLWQDYMVTLLSLPELVMKGFSGKPTDKMWEQVSLALYHADYHGAEIEVIRSKCSSLLGHKGIVLMDTKNTFKIIGRDNIVRTVAKSPCAFSFRLWGFQFTFFGKYFRTAPALRSSKKAKGHYVADI